MCSEERLECSNLIPSHEHLALGVTKESTNIGCVKCDAAVSLNPHGRREIALTAAKSHASDTIGQDHLYTNCHMLPGTEIIAGPHGTKALRPSVECTREDERSFRCG
jgi:hypothetical protein